LTLAVHQCPICGNRHEVTRAQAEMALGSQLCCSPACENEDRRRSRARQLKSLHIMTEAAAFIVVLALLGIVVAVKWT
jgi:hypothetical protein